MVRSSALEDGRKSGGLGTPRRWTVWSVLMAGLLACGPAAAGDWSFEIDPGGMSTLASEWQEYFGVHYATVDRFEPEWFARPVFLTVRGYGGPHVLPPQIDDPETGERVLDVETLAEHNPPKTGPFTGKDVFISLADITGNSGVGLDALVPGILDNGLTAVIHHVVC